MTDSQFPVFRTVAEMHAWRCQQTGSVGFVPTMGALHEGHRFLIERSVAENDHTVLSIFVNPTQFNDPADLEKYPRTEEADLEIAQLAGVSAAFIPTGETMYPDNYLYEVQEKAVSKFLCGPFRQGHFAGVLTVVLKLFHIITPTRAYFGEKDFQQLKLIEGMVRAFFLPVEIVPCPTVREFDGLAMSSRNRRLTFEQREQAAWIPKVLRASSDPRTARAELERMGYKVDYVEDIWNRRFAAVYAGDVRLIDNVEI